MTHDVWLMLLGFNVDYWEQKDVEKAISDFGKLIAWEEDPNYLSRIIVKARVVDLTEIPWLIVCSEGENFEGKSWTAQCEILQATLLGGGPPDEEDPPNGPDDVQPQLFEFFGIRQPGHGPHANPVDSGNQVADNNVAVNENEQENNQDNQPMEAEGWGLWPEQQLDGPAIGPQPGEPFLEMNDLAQQQENAFDLNEPLEEDLGGIEELIQAADNWNAQQDLQHPEQIIDAGIFIEEQNPPVIEQDLNKQVEVFIPQDQFNPYDINEDDLMDHDSDGEIPQENIQLGFVELQEPIADPVFSSYYHNQFKPNAEAVRLWAKFLAPGNSQSNVHVPHIWTDFFTALLLNPASFMWAKQFLSSQAWNILAANKSGISFSLPNSCPSKNVVPCLQNLHVPVLSSALEDSPEQSHMDNLKEKEFLCAFR